MVEAFTTNIPNKSQTEDIITTLENNYSALRITFDMERKIIPYPL